MDTFPKIKDFEFVVDIDSSGSSQEEYPQHYKYVYNADNEYVEVVRDYRSWFPYDFNRAFYPVDCLSDSDELSSVSSLIYLCCAKVSRDASFLKDVLIYLPTNRYNLLMNTMISKGFLDSAAILMSKWPSKTITRSAINSDDLLRSALCKSEFISRLARNLHLLCKLFFGAIENSPSPLRVLDLRGVPMGDAMVYFLIRQIKNTYIDRCDNYHIIIDCAIHSSCTVKKLTSLVNMANLFKEKYNPQLHINSIDIRELGEIECWTLLQALDSTDLVGLSVHSRFSLDFYTFVFTKFSSLKTLDIPTSKPPISDALPIHLIPNLRRLGYKVGRNSLCASIANVDLSKLEYLYLSGYSTRHLVEDDFRCLMAVPLVLCELNLSGHLMVEEHLSLWRDFLRSLAPTLTILKLNKCLVDANLFPSLVSFVLPLMNLRYLSLKDIPLSMTILHGYVVILTTMRKLMKLRLSCAVDKSNSSKMKGFYLRKIKDDLR